jgi:probable F420-dependent oxidoreductase
VKVRIAVAPGAAPYDLADLVDGLEARGFDTVWLSDVPQADIVDPIVGLSFAAGRTTKLKLGANVVPIGRNPFVLAKSLAQLDRLSGGRVLLSLVPGLVKPGSHGAAMEASMATLRAFWAGEEVDGETLPARPVQEPLELWLGGIGPKALERVGRLADGWLGAGMGPAAARDAVRLIDEAAAAAGRSFDPEHRGLSIGYARTEPDAAVAEALRARYPGVDPAEVLPVGRDQLRSLLERYIEVGLSKFVVRPSGPFAGWDEELDWLAEAVLDLQT